MCLKVVGGEGRGRNNPNFGGPGTIAPLILEDGVKASTVLAEDFLKEELVHPPLVAADPTGRLRGNLFICF